MKQCTTGEENKEKVKVWVRKNIIDNTNFQTSNFKEERKKRERV